MGEYMQEQKKLLFLGKKKLSKEIWQKVRELESAKQDYYSEDGKKEGWLVTELLNEKFYESILANLSLLVGKYHLLQVMAQKKVKSLKKGKDKEEEEENEDYGDWE